MRNLFVLGFALALSACSDDSISVVEPDAGTPDTGARVADMAGDGLDSPDLNADLSVEARGFAISSGGYEISWSPDNTFVWKRDNTILLSLPPDAFQIGVVASVNPQTNYDPYGLINEGRVPIAPPIDTFLAPSSAERANTSGQPLAVRLRYERGIDLLLEGRFGDDGRLDLKLTPEAGAEQVAIFKISTRVDTDEAFYGLGEHFDRVNQRGTVRAMQLEIQPGIESANNEAHVPVPLLVGTRGWGLFVNSFHPAAFDVAKTASDRVDAYFGLAQDSAEGLEFHLLGADHPLDITRHYYELTGYPIMPARWALGPWIWRDENEDQAQVESDLNTIRDLDLATTGYWIDRPYATAVNTFDFDAAMFNDPQAMINEAHALGFRMALWHTPYLDTGAAATQTLRNVASTEGYYPLVTGLNLNNWGTPIDLSNPDAYAWWQSNVRNYTEMGIEGFKLDYAEDIVLGVGGNRQVWEFANGRDERTMSHLYQHYYHGVYADLLPETGGFLLCRAGTIGDQTRVSVIWPGDLDANMAKHGEEVGEGEDRYVAVGGLPAALIASLTLGPSGFPLFASDTGGYRHSPPNKETFVRWFQVTALSPVMQVGTSANDVPWEFNAQNGFDSESLVLYRKFARLHLRLFPYVWSYLVRLREDGRPIHRALGLAHPELGVHPDDTFLLGDHIFAAPVVEAGATQKTFMLPPGEWLDWWTGERVQGGAERTVDAPLDTLPLYLSANGIVPMLRTTIDTMSPVADANRVDSYATTPGRVHARVAFGADASFDVFDGATLETSPEGADWELRSTTGAEMNEGVEWEILGASTPTEVLLDGTTLEPVTDLGDLDRGWIVDGILVRVRVPSGTRIVTIR